MSVRLTPWTNPYQSGIGTEITDEKEINVVLRDTNNLIQLTQNNELYTDLQLANWLKPTDTIPVWRTVGRVLANDWWIKSWTLVCEKTTSGDIVQILYADDWTIWINKGNWWNEWRDRHSIFVTRAEYEALPNSKLTDWNCYIITDGSNGWWVQM